MIDENFAALETAIRGRHSTRAFLDTPVPAENIEHILALAARAPSGCNMQPWRAHVLTGPARQRVVEATCHAYDREPGQHVSEYVHTPAEFFEPFQSRRRTMGVALYGLAGIPKGDKAGMRAQQRRNYEFFGAPVGLLFTVHRDLPIASFIGYGAFVQNIMLAAQAMGLGTCFQTAWCDYHRVIAPALGFKPEEMLLGGMALGYADPSAPINHLQTERVPMSEFAAFRHD